MMNQTLEPVRINFVAECLWKPYPKPKTGRRPPGCQRCGKGQLQPIHLGCPPSLNDLGSGNRHAYQGLKDLWQTAITEALEIAELPKGLNKVHAEGTAVFPMHRKSRDEGNHRFMVEKALGDALDKGDWLEDDDWTRYRFGAMEMRVEHDVSATEIIIFPG